jgi:hypothetical protein
MCVMLHIHRHAHEQGLRLRDTYVRINAHTYEQEIRNKGHEHLIRHLASLLESRDTRCMDLSNLQVHFIYLCTSHLHV